MILVLDVDGQEQLIAASLLNGGRINLMRATVSNKYIRSRKIYHTGKLTVAMAGGEGAKLINFSTIFVF